MKEYYIIWNWIWISCITDILIKARKLNHTKCSIKTTKGKKKRQKAGEKNTRQKQKYKTRQQIEKRNMVDIYPSISIFTLNTNNLHASIQDKDCYCGPKTYLCTKKLYTNVHNSIIHNSQKVKTIQMAINCWRGKQNVFSPYSGILFSNKKGWNSNACYNMDDLWKMYAK